MAGSSSLFEALGEVRDELRETWAAAAASGYATPDTDEQLRSIWEARELLDVAASVLASLRVARPHDPNLGAAIAQLTNAHSHVYQVECSRHRELGSTAPGERRR